jgi:hypothetical protein
MTEIRTPPSSFAERSALDYSRANPPTPSCLDDGRRTHEPSFFTPMQSDGSRRCERCGHILAMG